MVDGFDEIDALFGDGDGDGLAIPTALAVDGLVEREHQLLRIEQWRFGVVGGVGRGGSLAGACRGRGFEVRAGGFGELSAEVAANVGAQLALPFVEALERGEIADGRGRAAAELVRVFDLLEKLRADL